MIERPVNPYEDRSYWNQVRKEQREDQRCSECGGFHDPAPDEKRCGCEVAHES